MTVYRYNPFSPDIWEGVGFDGKNFYNAFRYGGEYPDANLYASQPQDGWCNLGECAAKSLPEGLYAAIIRDYIVAHEFRRGI